MEMICIILTEREEPRSTHGSASAASEINLYAVLELCLKFDTSISLQKTITLLVDQLVNSHEETIDVSVCEEIFESIEALSIPSIEVKTVSFTLLRAHETVLVLVCLILL